MNISKTILLAAGLGLCVFFISGTAISDESKMNDTEKKKIKSSMMTGDSHMTEPMANNAEDSMKADMEKPMKAEMEDTMKTGMEKPMKAEMEDTIKPNMEKPAMSTNKS